MLKYLKIIKSHFSSDECFYALVTMHLAKILKTLRINFNIDYNPTSDVVDLFLPTIAKDFKTLQLVIEAAQKNICHKIGTIYVVSNENSEIVNFCKEHDYTFIDEKMVLGYGKEKIDYKVGDLDRSGWLFQQLLKFGADKIVKSKNFISIDSDTVLLKPHSFIHKGKFIYRQNEEWHKPYFNSFKKIFGYSVKTWLSYTSHMMIFNTDMLRELKNELEQKHLKPWDEVYISTASPYEISCISDYDTYANWVRYNYPKKVKSVLLYNRTLSRDKLEKLTLLEAQYKNKYHSISFHSYAKLD